MEARENSHSVAAPLIRRNPSQRWKLSWIAVFLSFFIMSEILDLIFGKAEGVEKHKFMTCEESTVCRRYSKFLQHQRNFQPNLANEDQKAKHNITWETAPHVHRVKHQTWRRVSGSHYTFILENAVNGHQHECTIRVYKDGFLRFTCDDAVPSPDYTRYKVSETEDDDVLDLRALEKQSDVETTWEISDEETIISGKLEADAAPAPLVRLDSSPAVSWRIKVKHAPFQLTTELGNSLLHTVNRLGHMNFERLREKPADDTKPDVEPVVVESNSPKGETEELTEQEQGQEQEQAEQEPKFWDYVADAVEIDSKEVWEQRFHGALVDVKKHGPTAVGIDVVFHSSIMVSGFAEHSTPVDLSKHKEPYRFYNSDVAYYELDSPMAIYGSVPYLTSVHGGREENLSGSFSASAAVWLNPSETWAWIRKPEQEGITSRNFATSDTEVDIVSESGVLDLLLLLGPYPQDVARQYHIATGFGAMPPLFGIAKQQCRWNYMTAEEVLEVSSKFDEHKVPLDVMWLDIEYTDQKKYFTWDPVRFANPENLVAGLAKNGRKLVTIIDPHIKRETGYEVFKELRDKGMFIKKSDNSKEYDGWCWPGSSSWPDFLDARVREHWKKYFSPSFFKGSSPDLQLWIDMNEPSVFTGVEMSLPRNTLHLSGREHRELHNLYGHAYFRASFEAMKNRDGDLRPLILSRAFFIGSHKYGATWTGDNEAKWSHLRASVPMILSNALSGMSFTGADVGGFFDNPTEELVVRWTQLGVWYPFYRDHAHIETKRREPWVWGEGALDLIRRAVQDRYKMLPTWYTLFAEYRSFGTPVVRPLWYNLDLFRLLGSTHRTSPLYEFQSSEFMVGDFILVAPIGYPMEELPTVNLTDKGSQSSYTGLSVPPTGVSAETGTAVTSAHIHPVYLPHYQSTEKNAEAFWYRFQHGTRHPVGKQYVAVDIASIPVYVKAGSIFVTKERLRRASPLMYHDPYTVHIYVDTLCQAIGTVFIDDFVSEAYRQGRFAYEKISFRKLKSRDDPNNRTYVITTRDLLFYPNGRSSAAAHGLVDAKDVNLPNFRIERFLLWGIESKPTSITLERDTVEPLSLQFSLHPLPVPEHMMIPEETPKAFAQDLKAPTYLAEIKITNEEVRFGNPNNWRIYVKFSD